ncbi:hypothetical protein E3O55_08495 [Cryobacterium sp. MDB1-18-2]|uniref:IPT/TIG domain-containing protein n=1 Tax=unclassified Cryobacterium TaxID=2649013 RepID=UPI001068EF2C|nr:MULTISPECIES: IPT/TIG domain-containing protein [unclassified Cryobacterium]TFC30112.1 hypothetical protein E3O55_08495 [Cryobacterium sp. MDB1-18-2]TFC41392.1 hypothetical protein E3O50_09935 [Cryobacterium sp. MDB1-18-1]
MSVDVFGNDVTAVGIPVTGFFGYAPSGTVFPTSAEGASPTFTLPGAFKKGGLFTDDGGFEWTLEPDGDPIVFWQDGYSIPSGLAKAELVAKLAQYDAVVRELSFGKTADANGYMTIDAGGHNLQFVAFTEEIFKNGVIRRRIAEVSVSGAKQDKSERGKVNGTQVTFKAKRSVYLNNEHIGEWLIGPPSAPVITAIAPTSAAAAATITITGTGFVGVTLITVGGVTAPGFTVVSPTSITVAVPAGATGSAPVRVTTPYGLSNAQAFSRA